MRGGGKEKKLQIANAMKGILNHCGIMQIPFGNFSLNDNTSISIISYSRVDLFQRQFSPPIRVAKSGEVVRYPGTQTTTMTAVIFPIGSVEWDERKNLIGLTGIS